MSEGSEVDAEQQDSAVSEPEEQEEGKVSENGEGMYLQYLSINSVVELQNKPASITSRSSGNLHDLLY